MKSLTTLCFVIVCASVDSGIAVPFYSGPVIVSREEWGAKDPIMTEPLKTPVDFVIIHHTYIPPACHTPEDCVKAVQKVQYMHMVTNGWNDLGYNFLVGGDGRAYVGRGWNHIGAHATTYNNKSIGICIIGDWQVELPPKHQLETVRQMIALGLEKGIIAKDYKLLGHRQTRVTECPGEALYQEIRTWPHFSPCPQPVDPAQWDNSTVCPFKS